MFGLLAFNALPDGLPADTILITTILCVVGSVVLHGIGSSPAIERLAQAPGLGAFGFMSAIQGSYTPEQTFLDMSAGAIFNLAGRMEEALEPRECLPVAEDELTDRTGSRLDVGIVGPPLRDVLRAADDLKDHLGRGVDVDLAFDASVLHALHPFLHMQPLVARDGSRPGALTQPLVACRWRRHCAQLTPAVRTERRAERCSVRSANGRNRISLG